MDKVIKPRGQLNTSQEVFWGNTIKLSLCIVSVYISIFKISLSLSKNDKKLKFILLNF